MSRLLARAVLPVVSAWVRRHERRILATGWPLSQEQIAAARRVGVSQPDRVRTLVVDVVPPRLPKVLRRIATTLGLGPETTVGIALGYGIYLRRGAHDSRALLVHELAHVAQHERLGFRPFLEQYVRQCLSCGYPSGELEREAQRVAAEFES